MLTLQQSLKSALLSLEDAYDAVHSGSDNLTWQQLDDMEMLSDAIRKVNMVLECNRIKL